MHRRLLRPRVALLLVAVLVAALGISAVVPRGSKQPAATAAATVGDCTGAEGSAGCFHLSSRLGVGDLGLGVDPGDATSGAAVQSYNVTAGTKKWGFEVSPDKTFVKLRNLASAGLCLSASASVHDGHLTDCASASRFRIAMAADVNVAHLVSTETVGYCLRDQGKLARPGFVGAGQPDLVPCGDGDGQVFTFSGPTAGAAINWPRKLALELAFSRCNIEPNGCRFTPDDAHAEPTLQSQSAGCLGTWDNHDETSPNTLSIAYVNSTQSARKLGSSVDQTAGVETMWEGTGITVTWGWNAYEDHTYTHLESDTTTYSVIIPPKMYGWLADTEYTGKASGVPLIRSAVASNIAGVKDVAAVAKSTPAQASAIKSENDHQSWILASSIGIGVLVAVAVIAVVLRQRRTPGRRRQSSHSPS
jgi:hypothetical protein